MTPPNTLRRDPSAVVRDDEGDRSGLRGGHLAPVVHRPSSFKDSQSTRTAGGSSTCLPGGRALCRGCTRCARFARTRRRHRPVSAVAGHGTVLAALPTDRPAAPTRRACPHLSPHLAVTCSTAACSAVPGPPCAVAGLPLLWSSVDADAPSPSPVSLRLGVRRRRPVVVLRPPLKAPRRRPIPRTTGRSRRITSNPTSMV